MSRRRNHQKGFRPGLGPGNDSRFGNGPPKGQSWTWLTQQMLESPAWRAMPLASRRVVDRIIIEQIAHAGRKNGELTVTYNDFAAYGIRRSTIIEAIAIAEALGFIDVTLRGRRSYGIAHLPSQYAVTWLPRCDGTPPMNSWQRVTSDGAKQSVAAFRKPGWRPKRPITAGVSQDIERSLKVATGRKSASERSPVSNSRPASVPKSGAATVTETRPGKRISQKPDTKK